jgi:3-deoxy-D-manno-octulosonate 8-phosphate phosphatase KdsC-like HAD superfamily phosphatase
MEKLKHIKAFVFDWDGVFTDGVKIIYYKVVLMKLTAWEQIC